MIEKQTILFVRGFYAFLFTAIFLLLNACGGGGSDSGSGGSAGSSGASSTLVLDVSKIDGVAAIVEPAPLFHPEKRLISRLLGIALSNSWASHARVFLNGTDFGPTSEGVVGVDGVVRESFLLAVTAGTYELRFVADDPLVGSCSTNLVVGDDQIVYLDNIEIVDPGEGCSYDKRVEDVDDDLIAGGDNSPNGKTLVCHKNKKAISVSPRSVAAHLKHGDATGPCVERVVSNDDNSIDGSDEDLPEQDNSDDKGNKPDKPGKPDKGNKPS